MNDARWEMKGRIDPTESIDLERATRTGLVLRLRVRENAFHLKASICLTNDEVAKLINALEEQLAAMP